MAIGPIQRIARAIAELIVFGLAAVMLWRYARLPDGTLFALLTVAFMVAIWLAYRSWSMLFAAVTERLKWTPRIAGLVALALLGAGALLWYSIGGQRGLGIMNVFLFAAMGASATIPKRQKRD